MDMIFYYFAGVCAGFILGYGFGLDERANRK